MEAALDFLAKLADKGVKLSVEGERLVYYAQRGLLTSEIKDEIIRHKTKIIAILSENRCASSTTLSPENSSVTDLQSPFPLSIGQRTHYILQSVDTAKSHAVPICITLGNQVDIDALGVAWSRVLRRFPILQTRVIEKDGLLLQMVDEKCVSSIRQNDLSADNEREFLLKLQALVLLPFDLQNGPLTRINVFNRGPNNRVLLIVIHHIIFDGYSVGILLKELFSLYKKVTECGGLDPAAALPGYREFVKWEEEMLASAEGRIHAEYWERQLSGELPGFKLLPDSPRGGSSAPEAKVLIERLPDDIARWVVTYSKANTLQPSAIFLALFQLLLHKYSNQNEIIVLMPTIVRPRSEFANAVGYFFNIVPIKVGFTEQLSLLDFMRGVQGTLLDALFHSVYPFSLMSNRQKKLEGNTEFRIFYAYQNFGNLSDSSSSSLQDELGISRFEGFRQKAEGDFELAFEVQENGKSYDIQLQGSADLYSNDVIGKLFEHFCVLAREVARNSERTALELPIITETERARLLLDWNNTGAEYPREKCIHQLFLDRVTTHPDIRAVTFGSVWLTYQQLFQKCSDLALFLQSEGVGPDHVVGLCMERSLELMIAIMGTVMAGGAYLPLDPSYPDSRLDYMVQDSQLKLILTQARLASKIGAIAGQRARIVSLDSQWPMIEDRVRGVRARGVELQGDVNSSNICYVIYTSGSTGNPKGVLVEHRALVNRINWMQKQYPLDETDVVLQKTPYSFDVSVWEFFWPMMCGASVVFAVPDGHMDVHYLERLINTSRVTTLHYVPSMLHAFLDNAREGCDGVRQIFCSGEALDRRSVDRYKSIFANASLHNLYGPTEAAIDVTAFDCSRLEYPFVPIGKPIDNTQIHILDRFNNLQPIGVPGELNIAGDGLARGYLNRPELTLERFVPNPFDAGRRMYRTGDLARWLPDGNIQYLGRIDVQVKIGGVRIETGEIEAHLDQHPAVRESVVIAHGPDGYKQLIAFYRARDTSSEGIVSIPHRELRAHLLTALPEYMIPAGFVSIETIPLSSNGKVDRRTLEQIEVAFESTQKYVAPRNNTEQQLVDLWGEIFKEHGFVLEQAKIGIHDNFFELGGNSMLATQLIYKIRWHLGVELPVRALFDQADIAQLADLIVKVGKSASPPEEIPVDLELEAVLDPAIRPSESLQGTPDYAGAGAVFLTGASGFLGAYLLRDLIMDTHALVHCLVRCRSEEDGLRRLKNNLAKYGLWIDGFASRIVVVPGDLARPLLGVGAVAFDKLAQQIDAVYHNGALVNFIYPYSYLKNSNVRGTEEVIRLAARSRAKPLHYISTGSVFPPSTDRTKKVLESDSLGDWREVKGGYAQSKWVAEQLVAIAASRGLPVRIYRPATVAGDSISGVCNTGDFIPRMFKSCIQLGVAPDTDAMIGMVPVDYVSKAVIHLSRQQEPSSRVFHLANPQYVPVSELGNIFSSLGYPMRVISYGEWRQTLLADARVSSKNALYPLLTLFTEETPLEREPPFDCRHTLEGLDGTRIGCPSIDTGLMSVYLKYFKDVGFLD